MPKIELNPDELTIITSAIDTEIRSAKRQQNTSKSPQIKEVWSTHERMLEALKTKVNSAK